MKAQNHGVSAHFHTHSILPSERVHPALTQGVQKKEIVNLGIQNWAVINEALQNYIENRSNGGNEYNPSWEFPNDGVYKWETPDDCKKSKVRYTPGPKDAVWMAEKDQKYLARIGQNSASDLKTVSSSSTTALSTSTLSATFTPATSAAKEEKFISAQQNLRITREVVTHSSSVKNKKLLEAVKNGDLRDVKYWLQQGADINTCEGDENKVNVLQWSIRKSYREVVAFLLTQSGVNLAYQDGYGLGMLQTAITVQDHYDETIVKLLEKKGLVLGEPYAYAVRGDYKSLATLKTQRVDLSKADKAGGFTVLHYASARGQLQTVQWIVTNIPNIINVGLEVSKDTALLLAALNGHTATVEWLVTKGEAKVAEVNIFGNTTLLLAAFNGHTATVEWLLTKGGAKITETNNFGSTALLYIRA